MRSLSFFQAEDADGVLEDLSGVVQVKGVDGGEGGRRGGGRGGRGSQLLSVEGEMMKKITRRSKQSSPVVVDAAANEKQLQEERIPENKAYQVNVSEFSQLLFVL